MSGALAVRERTRFAACEARIERGLATFVEVGEALLEIRDSRLYRAEHATFEDYCRARWGISRPRAYELMHASEVVGAVSANADTPTPPNEAVARELAPLRDDPEKLREAWQDAVEEHGPAPTAAQVREKVRDPIGDAIKRIPQGDSRVYAIDTAAAGPRHPGQRRWRAQVRAEGTRVMDNDQAAHKLAQQLFRRAMEHHIDENLSGPWQRERGSYAFDVRICDFQTVDFGPATDHVARVVITVGG